MEIAHSGEMIFALGRGRCFQGGLQLYRELALSLMSSRRFVDRHYKMYTHTCRR
jgi:hypothetical protein